MSRRNCEGMVIVLRLEGVSRLRMEMNYEISVR
jgi:hypothetical protein